MDLEFDKAASRLKNEQVLSSSFSSVFMSSCSIRVELQLVLWYVMIYFSDLLSAVTYSLTNPTSEALTAYELAEGARGEREATQRKREKSER